MVTPHVFDVTASAFQTEVVERSLDVPVLLDFWAEWCGPCKTFGPILEKVAEDFGGAFVVAKVDTEAEIELGQAFQVQGIPFGVLIHKGRPVDAFSGALSEEQLRALLQKHKIEPTGEVAEESEPKDENSPVSRLRAARDAVRKGDVGAVRMALEGFPEEHECMVDAENLLRGLPFLEADLPATPEAAAHLSSARQAFLAGAWEACLSEIVASAEADKSYGEGLCRKAMLLCQGTLGDIEPVEEYRRRLATLLY